MILCAMPNPSFPYETADYESIGCNLCLRDEAETLHDRDRNGLQARTVICQYCGLIYLNPRMTSAWYARYYSSEYRAQMARFKGKPLAAPNLAEMFEKATKHGAALAERFREHWRQGLTIEVGSSVGGVLHGIRQRLGVDVLGIEPSPDESAEANRRGIPTHAASIEDFREQTPLAANILCSQSLNHLLDPRYFFGWAHDRLMPGGRLVLEVMNLRHVFRHFRWMQRAIQIDHTYMFVPEVLEAFVQFAGYRILQMEVGETLTKPQISELKRAGLPIYHIGLVAEKLAAPPFQKPESIPKQYGPVHASLAALPNSERRYRLKRALPKWLKRFG